jgi:hypothetical protein
MATFELQSKNEQGRENRGPEIRRPEIAGYESNREVVSGAGLSGLAESAASRQRASAGFTAGQNAVWEQKYREIEQILESDLEAEYFRMSPAQQQAFKSQGEQVTAEILKIIVQPKIKIKKIIELIKDWLRLIPGVNRFFLEQTAKIKTDKILNQTRPHDRL